MFKRVFLLAFLLYSNNFQLFGPDCHSPTLRENQQDFDYYPNYILETCPESVLDGVTYHCYINQSNQLKLL